MWRYRTGLYLVLASLLFLIGFNTQAATEIIERRVIVTKVPDAKTPNVPSPTGSVYCFVVEAGWFKDIWVPRHQVCQYADSPQGVVWIEGYWACNKYNPDGNCTNWDWKAAHWGSTYTVY